VKKLVFAKGLQTIFQYFGKLKPEFILTIRWVRI